jgi:hypothetical protein
MAVANVVAMEDVAFQTKVVVSAFGTAVESGASMQDAIKAPNHANIVKRMEGVSGVTLKVA